MNEFLLSLLAALQTQITGLATAVNDVQITLAKVMGYICGGALSAAVNQTTETEPALLPPPSDVKFKRKEFAKMTESVRIAFQDGHIKAHMRVRKDGLYEVRAQLDKKVYTGAGKTEDEAIDKFISCVNAHSDRFIKFNPERKAESNNVASETTTFETYAKTWLEVVKKPNIREISYTAYLSQLTGYLIPKFGKKQMSEISALQIQEYLNGLCEKGNGRTAKQLYLLLHSLFDYAVADDILAASPMRKLSPPKFEQKESQPLTPEQEKSLIERFESSPDDKYLQAYVFILFTGLRRSELATAVIEGDFVKVVSAKQRAGKKEKTRFVPITPMLAKYLPKIDMETITAIPCAYLTAYAPKHLDGHHTHELRHTFVTRCQECGARQDIVAVWVGHKSNVPNVTDIYTHLDQNKKLHLEEAQKVIYDI
ncbi:MAG: site-specific integrase [Clostridia bacterium]|nr:site-specific integrase [Clostridia bacterium]